MAGVLSTPLLMLIEALEQTHFDKPEIIFTLSDIYSDSGTVYHAAGIHYDIVWQLQLTCLAESTQKAPSKPYCPYPFQGTKLLIGKILHPASLDCYANPCNMGRYIYRLWAI